MESRENSVAVVNQNPANVPDALDAPYVDTVLVRGHAYLAMRHAESAAVLADAQVAQEQVAVAPAVAEDGFNAGPACVLFLRETEGHVTGVTQTRPNKSLQVSAG